MKEKNLCEICTEYSTEEECERKETCKLLGILRENERLKAENKDLKMQIRRAKREVEDVKKVTLYIDNKYADALSITAVGLNVNSYKQVTQNVATGVFKLESENVFKICSDGSLMNLREQPEEVR